MDDQTGLTNLENLLLHLALETRELAQKKVDLKQQIQFCKDNVQEKKNYINEVQTNINKLQEEILKKHNTVKCYNKNVKSLRGMNNLLLQYEKTLEAELENSQESCNQDMKMFEERIKNYTKVFQKHKEEYSQNPQIISYKNELKTLQVDQDTYNSDQKIIESQEQQALPSESRSKPQTDCSSTQDPQPQCTETEGNDQFDTKEKALKTNQDQIDETQEAEEERQERIADLNTIKNVSCQSAALEKLRNVIEIEGQRESEDAVQEEGSNEGAAPLSPAKMITVQNMPTFSENSGPNMSPGHQENSESPAFTFSLNSDQVSHGFPGFGCNFEMGTDQQEETSFTFTSPYFSNKKSPEEKLAASFLFEELESHPEEFAFSFGSKSSPSSPIRETGGIGEAFPFSFSFGKF